MHLSQAILPKLCRHYPAAQTDMVVVAGYTVLSQSRNRHYPPLVRNNILLKPYLFMDASSPIVQFTKMMFKHHHHTQVCNIHTASYERLSC